MNTDDIKGLFTQELLEGCCDVETPDVIEEGLFDRMRVRIRSLKGNFKNKLAKIGIKLGAHEGSKEGAKRNVDMLYIETLGEELDRIYKPKFQKLFKQYFKDSAILTGSIIEDHGVNKKISNLMFTQLSDSESMEQVYIAVKEALSREMLKRAKQSGLDLTGI